MSICRAKSIHEACESPDFLEYPPIIVLAKEISLSLLFYINKFCWHLFSNFI